jgi:hypothetical protein
MNKTLYALMTKLQWQLSELTQQLTPIEQQLEMLEQQLIENKKKVDEALAIPAFILPECEISRLHFIMSQQQKHDRLNVEKTAFMAQKNTINAKKTRLNIELKMLEKYQLNQSKEKQQHMLLIQQNLSDEWALQRREQA